MAAAYTPLSLYTHFSKPRAPRAPHTPRTPRTPRTLRTLDIPHIPRTPIRNMSSDADYAAFLEKANQDVSPAEQQDLSKKAYGTKSVNTAVPELLESVEEYYVSDADEPFEPVALEFHRDKITAGECFHLC